MSNSSQQQDSYSNLTLTNDITIDLGGTGLDIGDITMIDNSTSYFNNITNGTITITSGGSGYISSVTPAMSTDTIVLSGISTDQYTFAFPEEWRNAFPEWERVQDMCEKYPGLKIAFDNFKVFYEMVKDDYDNPTPKK